MIKQFPRTYGQKEDTRIIHTDQDGEMAGSALFQQTLQNVDYAIENTGADNSIQNGIAEQPHCTLADIVRTSLETSALPIK